MILRYKVTAADLRAFPSAARDVPHGRRLRQPRPQGRGRAADHDPQRARLRHHRGRRPRHRSGAGAAPRPAAAPRCAAPGPAGARGAMSSTRWCGAPACRPSASSAWADRHRRRRCAPRRSGSGWCSSIRTCQTAPNWASASAARATLEELLRQTDMLSVHAPLTPETRGMLGAGGAGAAAQGRGAGEYRARADRRYRCAGGALLKSGHLAGAGWTWCRWSRRSSRCRSCCGPTARASRGPRGG